MSTLRELYDAIMRRTDAPTVTPAPLQVPYDPAHNYAVLVRADGGGYEELSIDQGRPRPTMRHTFHDVASFAAFVEKHLPDATSVQILAGPSKIVAMSGIDFVRDEVSCALPWHPDLIAWEAIFQREYSQAKLYKALAAVSHTIYPVTERATSLLAQLQSVGVEGATKVELSEHGLYTLRSDTAKLSGSIDSTVRIACPIYLDDTETRSFLARVYLDNEGGPMRFSLRPVDLEVVKRAAYVDRVDELRALLPHYLVGMGDVAIG